ncbi:DUF3644 domain-containing protein [Francisella hispaniensis]|uniref:DUF3644 domain-containing protein n=1 Tax=Francisella hispaniensis TaxID=622488 RepID=UPI001906E1F8|nr:DUF3644 domain-containing protein [Francisella hispaniensis]MBK2357775.1 DUF3644 domain-containing protein [Francisella hispaniensis]
MSRPLRKGVAKQLLESSTESVLCAVEMYNKPRASFRVQTYITLMIIGWTKLFHAYFHRENVPYFYKKKNGRFDLIDGEKRSWDISHCIKEIKDLDVSVKKNLSFFIQLRNKIEHRNILDEDIEKATIGECQALLYNYESFIMNYFGREYAINESLRFSLQFSLVKEKEQLNSEKRQLSSELKDIKNFIETYRSSLTEDEFNSQKYSVKFIIIPKISNSKRGDFSIDFVKANELTADDYEKITAVIKDKKVKTEVANYKKHKPSAVIEEIRQHFKLKSNDKFSPSYHHSNLVKHYKLKSQTDDPFDTKSEYCIYDDAHNDYVYTEEWVEFLKKELKPNPIVR